VSSGGLGREVSTLLRALSMPGVEQLFSARLLARPAQRRTADRRWLGDRFVRPAPVAEEMWRSWPGSPTTTRGAPSSARSGPSSTPPARPCASDRLYLAALLPTLIVWGARDTPSRCTTASGMRPFLAAWPAVRRRRALPAL
jgi:hypothetical protein